MYLEHPRADKATYLRAGSYEAHPALRSVALRALLRAFRAESVSGKSSHANCYRSIFKRSTVSLPGSNDLGEDREVYRAAIMGLYSLFLRTLAALTSLPPSPMNPTTATGQLRTRRTQAAAVYTSFCGKTRRGLEFELPGLQGMVGRYRNCLRRGIRTEKCVTSLLFTRHGSGTVDGGRRDRQQPTTCMERGRRLASEKRINPKCQPIKIHSPRW